MTAWTTIDGMDSADSMERNEMTPVRILLRPEEAAKALGISRSQCYSLLAAGGIPSVLVGRSRRVPVAALEEWVAARTTLAQVKASAEGAKEERP